HWQNWNSRCADCHSTAVEKNYQAEANHYNTSFAEINVGCESCHGPGGNHVAAGGKGHILNLHSRLAWHFAAGASIAHPVGEPPAHDLLDTCGGCHSRRDAIAPLQPDTAYHDQYDLALLDASLYHTDGQIRDEVFVMGSFLQSKMHRAGVTCTDCHEPHSGQTRIQGNDLCAQCHLPSVFDTPKHHFHQQGSAGAACVSCHMPEKTFMQVDGRRDHQFAVPHRGAPDSPSACRQCHQGELKFPDQVPERPGAFGLANHALGRRDQKGLTQAVQFAAEVAHPAIQRATIINNLPQAFFINQPQTSINKMPQALNHLTTWTKDPSPLVRRAAAELAGRMPFTTSRDLLKQLLTDPMKSVRNAAARSLATHRREWPPADVAQFTQAVNDYRKSLALNADSPATQTRTADLELSLGRAQQARAAYKKALALEPLFVPALLNLADLERASGKEAAATALLKKALQFAPDSSAVNFSYGLSLVRRKQPIIAALQHFAAAVQQANAPPRYAYVYAVALDSNGQTQAALEELHKALQQWPEETDLLQLQSLYQKKLAKAEEGADN
ncbi:MAG: HEAT repeat domain-containing protein, partial [Pseudomonadales bacterium]